MEICYRTYRRLFEDYPLIGIVLFHDSFIPVSVIYISLIEPYQSAPFLALYIYPVSKFFEMNSASL